MNLSAFTIGTALLIVGSGCTSSRPQANAEIATRNATPAASGTRYMVEMRVIEIAADGTTRVLSQPQIMLAPGQEGKVEITGEPSAVLTARVTPTGT
jgi:hypothetical protein